MKSKASATSTRPITMPRLSWEASISAALPAKPSTSGVFQDDAFDDVGDVLAAVGDGLEELVDHAQLHHLLEVVLLAEELRERRAHHPVGVGLEPVDLLAALEDRLRALHVG